METDYNSYLLIVALCDLDINSVKYMLKYKHIVIDSFNEYSNTTLMQTAYQINLEKAEVMKFLKFYLKENDNNHIMIFI